jgi:RHS repeat-associated protein
VAEKLRNIAAAEGSVWTQNYGYDPVGNRWLASYSGLPTPTLETPVAQSWYPSNNRINTWGYDGAGNVTQVASMQRSFSYDAESRQATATINGQTTNYGYDGDGRRVSRLVNGVTTVYVYDAMGELAAEYSSGAPTFPPCVTCYLTADHLGSTRAVTDSSGTIVARHDYLPFGEEIFTANRTGALFYMADSLAQKFTGKERDAETGIDYFGARYFSGAQGRFTSADPIGGHYSDPQTLNKYAYVRNNPLRYVDPDGLDLKASCNEESDTCHKAHWWSGRYEGAWDQDHKHFTVTNFQTDSSGNLAGHTINFDASGIHIDGHQGSFIAGTDRTRVNGTGDFSGTHFVANSNCLRTCVAGGGLFNPVEVSLITMAAPFSVLLLSA